MSHNDTMCHDNHHLARIANTDSPRKKLLVYGSLATSGAAQATDDMNAVAERYAHLVLVSGSMIQITSTRFMDWP
jgi:hypothetical protein